MGGIFHPGDDGSAYQRYFPSGNGSPRLLIDES